MPVEVLKTHVVPHLHCKMATDEVAVIGALVTCLIRTAPFGMDVDS